MSRSLRMLRRRESGPRAESIVLHGAPLASRRKNPRACGYDNDELLKHCIVAN